MKVLTILGTRPEIIRLSEVIKKLDKYTDHILVHTGQSFDYKLSQVFFDELGIRKPNYRLDVGGLTLGKQLASILEQSEEVLTKEKPDAVLILGDTNSALSCIIAKRLHIPVFHMEAGNRCFDDNVPEEVNRRIVDHTSDVNLCYTEHAKLNLLREGLYPKYIFITGSPLPEVYSKYTQQIHDSDVITKYKLPRKYILVSVHREENVTNSGNLHSIIDSISKLSRIYDIPVLFTTHPRTRERINDLSLDNNNMFYFCEPFGLFDYLKLEKNAFCVLSDSGTIHEDAAILNFPAVNVRNSQERPEVYETGNVVISGTSTESILNSVKLVRAQLESGVIFDSPYGLNSNCSEKVVRLITGYSNIVKRERYYA